MDLDLFRICKKSNRKNKYLEKFLESNKVTPSRYTIYDVLVLNNPYVLNVLLDAGFPVTDVVVSTAIAMGTFGYIKAFESRGYDIRFGMMCRDTINNPDTVRYYLNNYDYAYGKMLKLVRYRPIEDVPLGTILELNFFHPKTGDLGRPDVKRVLEIREKIALRVLKNALPMCGYLERKFMKDQKKSYELLFGSSSLT